MVDPGFVKPEAYTILGTFLLKRIYKKTNIISGTRMNIYLGPCANEVPQHLSFISLTINLPLIASTTVIQSLQFWQCVTLNMLHMYSVWH